MESKIGASTTKSDDTLKEESKLRRKVHDSIQDLIDTATEEKLADKIPYLDCLSWDEVIEERYLAKCCGFPVCSNSIVHSQSHKYHIDRKSNKIYETCKERSKYCSEPCFNASMSIRIQLDLQPLWITGENFKRMSRKYIIETPKKLIEEVMEIRNLSVSEKPKRKSPYSVEIVEDTIFASMDNLKIAERDGASTEEEGEEDEFNQVHKTKITVDSDDENIIKQKKEDAEFKESVNRFVSSKKNSASALRSTRPSVSIDKSPKVISKETEKEKLDRLRAKYSKKEQTRKPILIDAPALTIKRAHETNRAEMIVTNEEMEVDGEKVGVTAAPIMLDSSIIVTPCSKEDINFVTNLMRQWWSDKSNKFFHAGGLRPANDIDRLLRRFLAGDKGEDIELEDVSLPEIDALDVEKRRLQILLQNIKPTWLLLEKKLAIRATQLNTLSSLLSTFRLSADNIAGFERQHLRLIAAVIWRIVCRFTDELEESYFPGGFISKDISDYLEYCGIEEPAFAQMCDDVLQLVQ